MGHYIAWRTELLTVILIVLTTLGLPLVAAAQRPGHVPRIAVLELGPASEPRPWLDAFRHGLRERGWVEGHTIAIEWRWAGGSLERFASLVAELVRLPVEILVVPNTRTAMIAKEVTTTIPIVVGAAPDFVELGLVDSRSRPGGNLTGLETRSQTAEMLGTQLPRADEMDAYERVLGDAMQGDATLFAREDYVEEAWRIVDPVLKETSPVYEYEPGTWGPKEVDSRVSPPGGWRNPTVRLP